MRTVAFLLLCGASCFAQLDDNTITVTATRTVVLQPDQAVVSVNLSTAVDGVLDDALAILDGTGFTAADLGAVNTYTYYDGALTNWQFSKAIPFSGLKALLSRIVAVQQSRGQNQPIAYVFTYDVSSQVSQSAQQAASACPIPTLVADARAQAQQIANAAGARIGAIVSLNQVAQVPNDVSAPIFLLATSSVPFTSSLLAQAPQSPGCSVTVQFQLLR
jgi:uncharacterized protein YggE